MVAQGTDGAPQAGTSSPVEGTTFVGDSTSTRYPPSNEQLLPLMAAFESNDADEEYVDARVASTSSQNSQQGETSLQDARTNLTFSSLMRIATGNRGAYEPCARDATQAPPGAQTSQTNPAAAGSSRDGVFQNLVAKADVPDGPPPAHHLEPHAIVQDEFAPVEMPPTYEEAAADSSPSYWETTIMASDWVDDVIVDDLPVGSFFHFIWNLLISVAFNYIGFILTYLVHTTHASRAGSLIGLSFTLMQNAFELQTDSYVEPSRNQQPPTPSDPNSFEGSTPGPPPLDDANSPAVAQGMLIAAGIILVKATFDYARAWRTKQAILACHQPAPVLDEESHPDLWQAPNNQELEQEEAQEEAQAQEREERPNA